MTRNKKILTWKAKGSLKVENTISIMNTDWNVGYETNYIFLYIKIIANSIETESIRLDQWVYSLKYLHRPIVEQLVMEMCVMIHPPWSYLERQCIFFINKF